MRQKKMCKTLLYLPQENAVVELNKDFRIPNVILQISVCTVHLLAQLHSSATS